ncbi:tandem-95 repeat protein [bacterium]|nr:tandem-95 repeat protein [bacterium]
MKKDLNENNIVLPKEQYKSATTESDDIITYDQNAGLKNLLGQDRGISVNGTMTNVSMVISGNQTTITLKAFDPSKDRIKVDPSYGITKYSDMPLVQEGGNVAMNFVNESEPLSSGGSSFGATRYTKVVLENVNLADLKEDDFIFYNHSTSGNDTINGLGGKDYIEGGEGNDTLSGGNGNDKLLGGNGNDSISGDAGDDEIYGGDGNDSLSDYSGNNKIYGGVGDDNIGISSYYGASESNNEVYGEEGNDRIHVDFGTNLVKGGTGNDEFIVYGGDNQIYGEDGVDDFIIGKSYSAISNGIGDYTITDEPSSTTIHDFDPSKETIMLDGFDKESLNDFDIVQDGNDVVINLSSVQTLRLSNVTKSSLNQDNIIIPDKHIHDNYYYSFDDRTNEYSIEDLNKLMAENPDSFYQGPVAEIASDYDPVLMKMVSNFDATKDKIHLGKIKTLEKFEDLKITQHSIVQSYGSPSEFTLIDLGNGTFVKLNGFYNLTADNFTFNKAPTANLSSANINEDSQIVLDVVSKAVDIDDDVLSITGTTSPSHGSATIITDEQGRQKISYIPTANFNGTDQFNYTLSDGRGGVVTKTLTVTVKSVNDNPTVTIADANVNEDNSVIIDVLAGASDADGDGLSIAGIYGVTNGVVNIVDGKIVYTPNANYSGLTNFDYTISDGNGGFITKTLNINVKEVNDSPTASIASIATNEDNSVKIDVLAGASDVDLGDILSLTSVTNGLHGTASITTNTDGNRVISYVPNVDYNGSDVISYTISDNNGGSVTKELTVTVNAINDGPIVASAAQNQAIQSGKAFTFQLPNNLFSDVDGDSLTINATLADGSPLPSWLSFDGAKFSGTPNVSTATNFAIKLTATDPSGASVSSNFGINITNPNNAPVAKDDAFATNEDTSLTISFASILKNDSDIEDKTNIQKLTKDNIIFNNPSNGTITVTDTGIVYKPNKDYNGSDAITYQIKDSGGALSNVASINLTVKQVNDAPVVASDLFVTDEDTSIIIKLSDLLVNDSDVEDGAAIQSLTMDKFVFSNPSKGVIVKDAVNGTITYTPNKNYNGADSLTYQIKDSNGVLSNKVKINLSINAVNDAPIAANDSYTTNEDRVITINFASILRNDSDVEDGVNIKQITKDNIVFGDPVNGKITITDTGIIYAPNKDFNGHDSLTYQIKDSNGTLSNIANINLTIKAINDAPVVASDSFVTSEDSSLIIKLSDLLANDFDVEDGQAIQDLTLDRLVFSNPAKGKIVKDVVNNTIIYTPNKDYNGNDSLTYQIKDSNGTLSNKATISLTVEAINDAPVAGTKLADKSVKAGNPFSYTLPVKAFTDVDKDVLTYSAKLADNSELPSWLKFDSATKTFSGTSPSGITSALSIKVTVSDGSFEASQSFSLKITINVINGTSGNNSLNGTVSNDEIYGNDGVDTIKGNVGNDLIIGGKGADVLIGGVGNDQFIFKNLTDSTMRESDLILDFIKGEDKINLYGLGFDEISAAGSNHSAHGLEYYFDGKNTVIDDPNSNFAVKLAGDISLDHNDFAF